MREKLRKYRENIQKLYAEEDKLREIRRKLREVSANGTKAEQKKRRQELRDEAIKTGNRIDIYDGIALRRKYCVMTRVLSIDNSTCFLYS